MKNRNAAHTAIVSSTTNNSKDKTPVVWKNPPKSYNWTMTTRKPAADSKPAPAARKSNFETVKRNFETAPADAAAPLYSLGKTAAHSVLRTVLDPRAAADRAAAADDTRAAAIVSTRKPAAHKGGRVVQLAAADREAMTNSGQNPAIKSIKSDIERSFSLLENLPAAVSASMAFKYNADGVLVNDKGKEEKDPAILAAAAAVNAILGDTLGDGMDIVHDAIVAILEEKAAAADRAPAENWIDEPYTVNRLSRRVYIKLDDSAAYREEETTPIVEVYRATRRAVENSRAVKTDPASGYTYFDDIAENGDRIFYRARRFADIGGYDCNDLYTAGVETLRDYETMRAALDLTARQETVLRLREQGHGYKAIASYLGVTQRAIAKTCEAIQKKARAALALDIEYIDTLRADMTAAAADDTPAAAPADFITALRARAADRAARRADIQREIDSLDTYINRPMIETPARAANMWDYIEEYLNSGWFLK